MKKIVKKVVAKKAPVKKLVKAQKGVSTKFATKEARDSSRIYGDRLLNMKSDDPIRHSTVYNYIRQYNKGQAGYDKMGYEKDKWGRSKDDKWFGFDPKTKKYTTGPNQGKTHGQVMKSKSTKLVKAQAGISTGGDKPTAASIREARTKERGGPDPAINSPAYNKLFTSTAARDSANIYRNQLKKEILSKGHSNKTTKLTDDLLRQYNKGQAGYDKMGYKKDDQGRSKGDKWYGYDPKAKKYTMGPNKGKTHAQVMKSRTTKK